METTKNKELMSPFCEALMDATKPLAELRDANDTAIVICTDGRQLAVRHCGNYLDAVRMIFTKMREDIQFAELITEACVNYSKYLNESLLHQPFKEDTPISEPVN